MKLKDFGNVFFGSFKMTKQMIDYMDKMEDIRVRMKLCDSSKPEIFPDLVGKRPDYIIVDDYDNALTAEKINKLKQGTKIRFKRHLNTPLGICVSRIEVNQFGELYHVPEHNYTGDVLVNESMRFYNRFDITDFFYHFEIVE